MCWSFFLLFLSALVISSVLFPLDFFLKIRNKNSSFSVQLFVMFAWTVNDMTICFYCVRSLVPDLGCIPKEAFFSCFGESVFVPFPCCAWPQIHSWFWYVWVVIFHLDSWPTNFFLHFSMWATCAYNEKGTFWWCWPKYTANVVHLRKRA